MSDSGYESAGSRGMADGSTLRARGVGKAYRIYERPQDRLKEMITARFGRRYGKEFWALRDVSFEMARGETLGILGRNGSGKSTLLQIIAGTLAPTAGQVEVRGRVAALLELGSGFNPDFTGRENVILNGSILGLGAAETRRRFDEIAAFADIGEFIDQPVKAYSSGMMVRLAFAVASSVDADVVLIDEALAVGDIFFRQKCYARLEELRRRGAALLLVSHSMADIEQLCRRAVLLDHGKAVFVGDSSEAVRRYYLLEQEDRVRGWLETRRPDEGAAPATGGPPAGELELRWPRPKAFLDIRGVPQVGSGWARCTALALCDSDGQRRQAFGQGEVASFFYELELLRDIDVPLGGLVIRSDKGVIVHGKNTMQYDSHVPAGVRAGARLRFRQDIRLELAIGEYSFDLGFATLNREKYEQRSRHTHGELDAEIIRLCELPGAGQFTVLFGERDGKTTYLLHHGMANLPGSCHVSVHGADAAL